MLMRRFCRRLHGGVVDEAVPTPAPPPTPTPSSIQDIAPAFGWTGVAGSVADPTGWTVTDSAARTAANAMPGIRPLYDTGGLCFDENDLVIGFHAYAGNGSGAISGTAEALIEGNVYTLTRQANFRVDVNGNLRIEWGYFARLKHSLWLQNGSANVKYRFTPDDVTQSPRVIGPFKYTRRSVGQLYDYTIEVSPSLSDVTGARYSTLEKALNYLGSVSAQNPLIKLTESATYSLSNSTATLSAYAGGTGYANIVPNVGVTASFKGTATIGAYASAANLSLRYNGLRFVSSRCVFDFAYINTIAPDSSQTGLKDAIMDGVEWTNSAGRNSKYNLRRAAINQFSQNGTSMQMICRDMVGHDLLDLFYGVFSIVLQCEAYNIAEDITKGPANIYGLTVHDVRGDDIKAGDTAFMVSKTGSNFFRLTKRQNGSTNYLLDLESSADGSSWTTDTTIDCGYYLNPISIAAVVAAINAFGSGWSATLLHDVYDAFTLTFISDPSVTPTITGNSGSIANGGSFTLWQRFDVHGDVVQPGGATFSDNFLFVNVQGVLTPNWQQIFYQTGTYRDCFIINYACAGAQQGSITGRANSVVPMNNCHFWHMSLDQTFSFLSGSSSDAYCSVKNCLFGHDVTSMSVTTPANHLAAIDGNHFCAGGAPSGATNSSTASSFAALLNAPLAGDFTPNPLGGLASRASQVPFDLSGASRGAMSHVGALA